MSMAATSLPIAPIKRPRPIRWISTALYRRSTLYLLLLLTPPLLWFGVVYLGSLLSLLSQSFFYLRRFHHGRHPRSDARQLRRAGARRQQCRHRVTHLEHGGVRYRGQRGAGFSGGVLHGALCQRLAQRLFLYRGDAANVGQLHRQGVRVDRDHGQGGVIYWMATRLGLLSTLEGLLALPLVGGNSLNTSNIGRFLVFTYIWLPFMILPIQAAIERIPGNLLQASADLGARPGQTLRTVILPLAFPGIVAGSIFTFSLTLGDFIIPQLVGPSGLFIGNMVYTMQGSVGNVPLAAAFTVVPIVIIAVYLTLARKLGAFDAL